MKLPKELVNSLEGLPGFDSTAFLQVHDQQESITSIRLNPLKPFVPAAADAVQVNSSQRIPWTQYGYYLPQRPSFTFDPLFHAGCYYVQEASSMFLEQAILQHTDRKTALKVLDLSAAPGGKSTHIQSLIGNDSFLVSNDVIRSRAAILKENMIKWGSNNVVVTCNDPRDFAVLPNFFDIIVVDAPCSGSGLFRRDPALIPEWSLNNVQLCSQRQQRILADVWPALKKDGLIIYSTCSYSKQEDEDILDWLGNTFNIENCPITIQDEWNIIETKTDHGSGYRFWPDKVKGEGFFLTCFRKKEGSSSADVKTKSVAEQATANDKSALSPWITDDNWRFIKHEQKVYAWPAIFFQDWNYLLNKLRVIYSGTLTGELMRDKLIPDHALAVSPLVNSQVNGVDVDRENAIRYLQRKDINISTTHKGWQLVKYEGNSLGWINVLPNRINNYYPKEMRILKDK